jgi:DNA invertase Pin-like site-specific DNA recombinase
MTKRPRTSERTAVYLRISRDPDGTSTAPERQLKDCRAFARLRGWDIVNVHRDADVSAFRKGVRRPAYDELLAGIQAGAYDRVLVWRLDRLVRRTVEFADFWRLADEHGVSLASATQPIDTADPTGQLIVTILVAFAQMESETMSVRIKAREREAADQGRNKTAGWRRKRSFGHEVGWEAIHDGEAAVIRDVARRLLDGESVTGIARDLNDRGVPAPGGGRWSRRGLTTLIRAPRLWGWREYQGELTAQGDWPAILSEADGRALRELLDRPPPGDGDNRRRYLLSGVLRCGRCEARMRSGRTTAGVGRYLCAPRPEGGCGAVSILLEPTDEAVEAMVCAQLERPEVARALAARRRKAGESDEAALLSELAQIARERDELAADLAAHRMSRASWLSAVRAFDQQEEVLSARLAEERRSGPLDDLAGARPVDRYRSLPLERRRRVIAALVDRIFVLPVDDPKYLKALHETLADEADEYRKAAARLRAEARATDNPGEAQSLRRQAEKADQDARRRLRQVKSGANQASRFRPERLEPVWRA